MRCQRNYPPEVPPSFATPSVFAAGRLGDGLVAAGSRGASMSSTKWWFSHSVKPSAIFLTPGGRVS